MTLQKYFLEKRRDLIDGENVRDCVRELMMCLFIQIFNCEDQDGRYLTDSLMELSDPVENEP